LAAFVAVALAPLLAVSAPVGAQPVVSVVGSSHTTTVYVASGKSQDVRTGDSFVDISVGDPTIADVNPLTDHTLSILGKKMGTTRVSVYGDGKKLVGIFDVE